MYGKQIMKEFYCFSALSKSYSLMLINITTRRFNLSRDVNRTQRCFSSTTAYQKSILIPHQISTSILKRYFKQTSFMSNDSQKLLYVGKDGNNLKKLLGGFYVLSVGAAAASPYLFSLASGSTIGLIFIGIEVFTFVFLNPIFLYQFGKRYVNELYHNKKTDVYTAHVLSPWVYKDDRLAFSAKDCKMPANPTIFTSFFVNSRPLFINSDAMNYDDYMKMLRYASEFDFENPERQEQYSESVKSAIEQKQHEQLNETKNRKDRKK